MNADIIAIYRGKHITLLLQISKIALLGEAVLMEGRPGFWARPWRLWEGMDEIVDATTCVARRDVCDSTGQGRRRRPLSDAARSARQ